MKVCFLIVVVCCFTLSECVVPSFIKICYRNDPQLAKCFANAVHHLLPYLKTGVPEYGIPSIEPLKVSSVKLNTGTQAARVYANLTNLRAWNASTFIIREIIPNVNKNTYRFKVSVPRLRLDGNYAADTKVLFLKVDSKGPFSINVTDYYFDCTLKGNQVKRNNVVHLLFEKMKCDISFGKATIQMDNLFGSNPVLSQATNEVINDNLDAFYKELKPNLLDSITTTFTNIANKITNNFDYNEFFPIK